MLKKKKKIIDYTTQKVFLPTTREVKEEAVLFLSVTKWVFLSAVVGLLVGFSTTVFLKALELSVSIASSYQYYYLALPAALMLSVFVISVFAPDAKGHGTEKVIEAIHKRAGEIALAVVPVKLAATLLTIAAGGSAGKEGPCAQIGAGIASGFANLFSFNPEDRKKLVICGVSGGFSAVFGTPIAGAIFGVEVLFAGSMSYAALLPSFIAGLVSYHVASSFGVNYMYHPLDFQPVFDGAFFLELFEAGVFFGICSFLLIEILRKCEAFSEKLLIGKYEKAALGGILMILFAYVFSPEYLGLGLNTIDAALKGAEVPPYMFLFKGVATGITLSFGGSGGIVTPIFFVGSTAGAAFAQFMHLDVTTFASIGFVALLAGTANTPVAASIMAVELFGPGIAPYAAVACVISFLMTGQRSVYPSQVLALQKSPHLSRKLGA